MLRAYDILIRVLASIGGFVIVAVALLVCADVVARYFFLRPLGWPIDYSEYGLVLLTFAPMAWLAQIDGHVRIDLVLNSTSPRIALFMKSLASLVSGVACCALAYFATLTAITQFGRGAMTTAIHSVPRYWLSAIIAVGLAFTAIELFRHCVRTWREAKRL